MTPSGRETVSIGALEVRRIGLGAMRLGDAEPARAYAVLRRAVELGVQLIDTADAYEQGRSEERIAEALHPYPDDLVIATKAGLVNDGSGWWPRDGRPEHLRAACQASLRRLRLDRIDLLQLHRVDERVPLQESVGALAQLREEGMVAHVGLSNVSVDQLERAQEVTEIVSVQNRYNLGDRSSDDVVDRCRQGGLAFLAYSPLAGRGTIPARRALAELLDLSPTLVALPGTTSVEHLEENLGAR